MQTINHTAIAAVTALLPLLASAEDIAGQVRYRSLANTGGEEVYLGRPNLGNPHNRIAADLSWYTNGLPNSIEFGQGIDSNGGRWLFGSAGGDPFVTLVTPDLFNADQLEATDTLIIELWNRDPGGSIDLPSLRLIHGNQIIWEGSLFGSGNYDRITLQPAGACFGNATWVLDGTLQSLRSSLTKKPHL